MSGRCEPPEELRGVDGWHWLTEHNPVLWIADRQEWEWGEDDWVTPEAAYRYGYRYLAPVATPAEVAALRDALAKEEERGRGWCNDALEAQEQIALLKREVERLRGALERIGEASSPWPPKGGQVVARNPTARDWRDRLDDTHDTAGAALAHKEPGDEG